MRKKDVVDRSLARPAALPHVSWEIRPSDMKTGLESFEEEHIAHLSSEIYFKDP